MTRPLVPALLAAVLLTTALHRPAAEERIVRVVPDSGENLVDAQWGRPGPQPEALVAPARTLLSGRVSAGGSGGGSAAGDAVVDVFTDSSVSLLQPLGSSTSLQIDTSALRRSRLDGLEQNYAGRGSVAGPKWSLSAGGFFRQDLAETAERQNDDTAAQLQGTLNLGFIETLPISVSYSHDWADTTQEDTSQSTSGRTSTETDSANLLAEGTLGPLEVRLNGGFQDQKDRVTQTQLTGVDGALSLTFPVASFLKIRASAAPSFSRADYQATGNSVRDTSLASGLGVILPLAPYFELHFDAGRVDAWADGQGPEAAGTVVPYQVTWSGSSGLSLEPPQGFTLGADYRVAKTVDGNLAHAADARAGFRGSDASLVQEAGVSGDLQIVVDEGGQPSQGSTAWSAAALLMPAKGLSFSGFYQGRASRTTALVWQQILDGALQHTLGPELDYELQAHYTLNTGADPAQSQQYRGRVNLRPRIGFKAVYGWLEEVVGVDGTPAAGQVLSQTGAGISLPLLRVLAAQYGFTWEWVNRTAPAAGPGNAFRHTIGLTVGGETTPFSLSATYALEHGYRGLRQDLASLLTVPLSRGFALENQVQFSQYQEDGGASLPYLVTLTLVYVF